MRGVLRCGLGVLAALIIGVLPTAPAAAAPQGCKLKVNTSGATWSMNGYDPFSSSPLSRTFTVTFGNTGDAVCNFTVGFQTNAQPFGLAGTGGQRLPYTLSDNTNNVNVTPSTGQTSAASLVPVTIAPGGQQLIQYTFAVNVTDLPTDGTFQQQLLLTALSGTSILEQKSVQLSLGVAPSAVISLRGAYSSRGGSAYIELGDLRPGLVTSLLQLYVQSTGGYRIDAQSMNNGKLELAGSPGWAIPYSLVIGANQMDLSGESSFTAPRTGSARQDLLPINFYIGDTSQKRAGEYRDVITLSVTAL